MISYLIKVCFLHRLHHLAVVFGAMWEQAIGAILDLLSVVFKIGWCAGARFHFVERTITEHTVQLVQLSVTRVVFALPICEKRQRCPQLPCSLRYEVLPLQKQRYSFLLLRYNEVLPLPLPMQDEV